VKENDILSFPIKNESLVRFLEFNDLADLKFIVDGKCIFAHRIVIAIASDIFCEKLKTIENDEYFINDYNFDTIISIVKYSYGERLNQVDYTVDLLKFTFDYKINALHALIEKKLLNEINVKNVFDIHSTAKKISSKCLLEKCCELFENELRNEEMSYLS